MFTRNNFVVETIKMSFFVTQWLNIVKYYNLVYNKFYVYVYLAIVVICLHQH